MVYDRGERYRAANAHSTCTCRRMGTRHDINDWPIAAKITVLSTAIAIALACALTAIGYFQAAAGLSEQADREIQADAQLVEITIDDWHQQRLAALALGAVTPAFARVAEGGDLASPSDRAEALAILTSIAATEPGYPIGRHHG